MTGTRLEVIIEPTGPDTMVIINVGGQLVTVRLGARERPAPGEVMTLGVDTTGVSLFDPETEKRI